MRPPTDRARRAASFEPIAGYPKHPHSLAGSFCKKYLGYKHSETGYRRIFFIHSRRIFIHHAQRAKKKKSKKKLFSSYKIIDSENFIKVSQNPNKVARDTQGLPTVPHNDFGGLNFKGLASNYLLLMATSPYKVTFSKTKSMEKSSRVRKDLEFGILVESYVDSRSQNVCSFFRFCNSSRHVNADACGILR